MYRVTWIDGERSGHGDYCLSIESAEAWVKYLQEKYPNMTHKIEKEPAQ